jgi:hypothetical protein
MFFILLFLCKAVQSGGRDSVKPGCIRALIHILQVQNAISQDIELDAIKQELEEVRELVKNQSSRREIR